MGNLIIQNVKYSGKKYYFNSPEFSEGINIIEGDNGSGKSTLSYFIEFALGGDIKVFKNNDKKSEEEYKRIIDDKDNYVELNVLIDNKKYKLKRFITKNDIFVNFEDGSVKQFCVNRLHCGKEIFSDWMLSLLNIKRFELNLGEINWYFNFNDLFRLLNYDQDTEPRKIFKSPSSNNFVTDSALIRKSIFETLMGASSDEYFLKMNELNDSKLKKKEAKYIFDEFMSMNSDLKSTLKVIQIEQDMLIEQMQILVKSRNEYQKSSVKISDKFQHIEDVKTELVNLEIKDSQLSINKKNLLIEKEKIEKLLEQENKEIQSILNTIFTHEKLNLFDFKICPFCASSIEKEDKTCICGCVIENNYEKFLYDTSEYEEILKHRNKSISTIEVALKSYTKELTKIDLQLKENKKSIAHKNDILRNVIESIEYSGNTPILEDIDTKILELKDKLFTYQKLNQLYFTKEKYEKNLEKSISKYKRVKSEFESMKISYHKSTRATIQNFNFLYNKLMSLSSCKAKKAMIDDEYMPYIDDGEYREKSASVPKRMMYYFTLLAMGLKYKYIKHPKFLLMDTPEEAGIDDITENIGLLDIALSMSKNTQDEELQSYQFILTTGINKYPKKYEQFVKLRFRKSQNQFILTEREV